MKKKPIIGYPTVGRYVCLGRCSNRVRKNAIAAGLKPISSKQFVIICRNLMALQRIQAEGTWAPSVRYETAKWVEGIYSMDED